VNGQFSTDVRKKKLNIYNFEKPQTTTRHQLFTVARKH